MAKQKKNQPVEAQVEVDGQAVAVRPDKHCPELDRLLEQRGAETFVFIPLAMLDKKGRKLSDSPKAVAGKKAKLPEGEWHHGNLQHLDDDFTVPGALAFNVRRKDAREIAETMGVNQFMWGAAGEPAEAHDAKVFEVDEEHTWQSARRRAFAGLSDMVTSAQNLSALPKAVEESQTTMEKFWRLVVIVLVAAVSAGATKAALTALLETSNSTAWIVKVVAVLFYPPVIPALLVGIYLRVLMRRGEQQARDFTTREAEQNWTKVAPHLLALWALCWVAVLCLTLLQTVPYKEIGVFGRTDGVTTSFIICVWMLLPIASSHDVESLFSSAIESGITAAVSIFTIKVTLWVTNFLSDTLLGIIAGILQIDIPDWLEKVINTVVNFGAEVFFVAVLLGYAWVRTRQQFMRL